MQAILLAWVRNVGQTLKKFWLAWLLYGAWELVKDRATNSTNAWLDQNAPGAVKVVRDQMSFVPQSELGIVGWLFVLTILGIVIWAYVDTCRTYEATLPPSSPQDVANREKITVLFRAYGSPASAELQQIIRKLLDQFGNFRSGEARTRNEGHEIIAQLVHNGPYVGESRADGQLRRAIDGQDKVTDVGLQHLLAEFFVAYQNLVRWVVRLDSFNTNFVIDSKEPTSWFRPVLEGKDFVSWQEKHKLFHKQLRELLAIDDSAYLRKLVDGNWSDTFHS